MARVNINIRPNQNREFLKAAQILRYLISDDEDMSTKILCNLEQKNFVTTDKELYEALGSIKDYDDFKRAKLTKFFEVVDVYPFKMAAKRVKPILTFKKVEQLRKEALQKN